MSRVKSLCTSLAFALVLNSGVAMAHPAPLRPVRHVTSTFLYRNLHLTPEQRAQLHALMEGQHSSMQSYWDDFHAELHQILTPAQEAKLADLKRRLDWQTYVGLTGAQESRLEILRSRQNGVSHRQLVADLNLTPVQRARLQQYVTQRQMERAGRLPDELGLTADQKTQLRAWKDAHRSLIDAQRRQFLANVDTILNRDQKARFNQNLAENEE
ncbi:MAG: hypothetical protein ACYCW6_18630 [Candidatus Xenobia bacterium]